MSMMRTPVLLINASYEPIRILVAKRALTMVVKGVAEIELGHDVYVRPGLRMPSVIRLRRYVHVPIRTKILSRKNIYLRDGYRCLYCGERFQAGELSWDHVIPRSKGGSSDWDNLVTACKQCNHRKADRTPEEAGMPLLRRPLPRTLHTSRFVLRSLGSGVPEWNRYMFHDSDGEASFTRRG